MRHAVGNPWYFNLGRTEESVAAYRRSIVLAEELLAADLKNALARGDVAGAHWAFGLTLRGNDPASAAKLLRRSLDESAAVMNGSPHTFAFIHNAANSHIALAGALGQLGDRTAALAYFRKGLELQRRIAKARAAQPGLRHNMIATLTQLGLAMLAAGVRSGAREHLDEALRIAESVPRDNAILSKLPDIAACHAGQGRLSASAGNRRSRSCRRWRRARMNTARNCNHSPSSSR
ncbi:MAG: tetratricopeptide repeat protein [Bryobacteraceae bacterium]